MAPFALFGLAGSLSFHPAPPPGAPEGATFATVGGVGLRYLDVGTGPAVVLLHGFGSSLDIWQPIVPALGARHRVLAVDLKGFGWSGRPPGDYSPSAQAELVLTLLAERGIERAAVVGHSWGASVALAMALAAPDAVERLALVSAYALEQQVPSLFRWARLDGVGELVFGLFHGHRVEDHLPLAFYDRTRLTREHVERVERQTRLPGTAAAHLAAMRGQRYAQIEPHYARVTAPSLLLWGREDAITPLCFGRRLARVLPRAELVVYPRCGHAPMIEARAELTRDLLAFFAGAVA